MKKKILIALTIITASVDSTFAQQPSVVLSDKTGWHKIGQRMVDFKTDRDEMLVMGADRFASLKFKVTAAAIDLQDLEIYYENGKREDIQLRTPLMKGTESRVIDLKGGESALKKIVFVYRTLPNRRDEKATVEIWGLKTVPAAAAEFGFNTCTFSSQLSSLSRVDINNANTSTASTDWWVSNLYQDFVVPAGNFSISNNAMRISRGAGKTNRDNSPSLQSIYYPFPYSPSGTWHGRTFANGFLWRTYYAVNLALAPSPTDVSFPAIWADNGIGLDRSAYAELDTIEHMATGAGSANSVFFKHDWLAGNDRSTQFAWVSLSDMGNPVFDGVAFNALDVLWVPMAKNGGNGLVRIYVNGTQISKLDLQYSASGNAILGSGGVHPANFKGAFSIMDANSAVGFALYLTVGHSGTNASPTDWPILFKNIQVWQTQVSDMKVN